MTTKYVVLSADGTQVVGEFGGSQLGVTGMTPPATYAEISDADPRYVAWRNAALLSQVDAFRDQRLAAGFNDTGAGNTGKVWQCDEVSRGFWNAIGAAAGLDVAANRSSSYEMISADNSTSTLTSAQASALIQGRMMPWVSATVLYARTLKDNILAGNPPADITQGWP